MALAEQPIKHQMYCPRCLSPLIYGPGEKMYTTLIEDTFNFSDVLYPKKYYICPNEICPASSLDLFWDEYGDYYTKGILNEDLFIFRAPEAVNSSSRHSRIENKSINLTVFHAYWFKLELVLNPIADELGLRIVGYKKKIDISLRKGNGSWELYISGIRLFFFCIHKFRYGKKGFLRDSTSTWHMSEMLDCLERKNWEHRWWAILSSWILNKLHPGLKEKLKKCLNRE